MYSRKKLPVYFKHYFTYSLNVLTYSTQNCPTIICIYHVTLQTKQKMYKNILDLKNGMALFLRKNQKISYHNFKSSSKQFLLTKYQ